MGGLPNPQNMASIFVIFITFLVTVHTDFINFEPEFEYQYKFHSTADVDNLGKFHVLAKVGYTNIGKSPEGQEVFIRVYAFNLKTKHSIDTPTHDWDFSKWFSFVITPYGEITHVYHPADDDEEAVALKKGLAAMFASKLHHHTEGLSKKTDNGWSYDVKELGQEGEHNASYTVEPTEDGHMFTKIREGHHPVKHATSTYKKTLYYNKDLGTIHTVLVDEKFRVMHRVQDGYDPFENTKPVKAVNDFEEFEYPEFSALGSGKLEFLTRQAALVVPGKPESSITRASIHIDNVKRKKPKDLKMDDYIKYIEGNLTCMRNEPEQGSKTMTKCFTCIVGCLRDIPDVEIEKLATQYLVELPRLTRVTKNRNFMFDALGVLNTEHSQRLLLDRIINVPRPNAFLVQRLLVHIITMETPPIDNITEALEDHTFHPENYPATKNKDSYHRIVLTVGVIAQRLWDAGRKKWAVSIVNKLENLLGIHDPWLYRQKRSLMTEEETINEDHWHVVLIESLGNAGLDQSYEHIVSHVNSSNSQWVKRAGIHAMRKYHHDHAAHLMLKTALYDDDEKVRYEALLQYQAHPKAAAVAPMYKDQEGYLNGSIFYEDPYNIGMKNFAIHRRRKRFADPTLLDVKIASPGITWKKILGSLKIGASFGIIVSNRLDLKITALTGYGKLDIHDEAYARIHLGVLGINLDFFLARLCFKGIGTYDANILQDFDPSKLVKVVEMYDKIKTDVVDAITSGIDTFKAIINGGADAIGDLVDNFKNALESLPDKVLEIGKKAVQALLKLGEMDERELPGFIQPAVKLIKKVTTLFKDIKTAVMTFYNTLMETITVVIPRAATTIYDAIEKIINGFSDLQSNPKKALSAIGGNVVSVGMEIKNLIEAINKTKKACFFLKKERPYWWDLKAQFTEIKDMAVSAVKSLTGGASKWVNAKIKESTDRIAEFTKGKMNAGTIRKQVIDLFKGIIDELLSPLDGLGNLGGQFRDTFEKVAKLVKDVKEAYNMLNDGYQYARSLIDRVFGPKCHKKFPRIIRLPSDICPGDGNYPSNLTKPGQPEYEATGVDIQTAKGQKIVAPFTGTVTRSAKPNEVILTVSRGSLRRAQVYITNIRPNRTIKAANVLPAARVVAGQQIGLAVASPCADAEHIHFAVKKRAGFIDPKLYLEPKLPGLPTWQQACDDYKLVFKTIAAGSIIGLAGRKKNNTSPKRKGKSVQKPVKLPPKRNPAAKLNQANNNPNSAYNRQREPARQTRVQEKVGSTNDSALRTMFNKADAFMKKFSVLNLKLGSLLDILDILGMDESKEKMADIIKTVKEMIDNKQCFNPHQMSDDELRAELVERGKKANGTRAQMINVLTTPSNSCPAIKLGLPKNLYCTFDTMCLGVECCVTLKVAVFRKSFKVYARFDPCQFKFIMGIDKRWSIEFGVLQGLKDIVGGFDKAFRTGIIIDLLGGIELVIKAKLEKDDRASLLTVGAGFCSLDDIDDCFIFLNLLDEVPAPLPICHDDGTMTWPDFDFKSLLNKEALKKRFLEKGKSLAKKAVNTVISKLLDAIPCISKTVPGKSKPCSRPETLTIDQLKQALQQRKLAVTGTKADLISRLQDAHKKCSVFGKSFTLPSIPSEKINKVLYLQIAPNCLKVEACLDFHVKALGFNKAFRAYIELDACKFELILNFEDCTERRILFGFPWGQPGQLKLSEQVIITFKIDRNVEKKVFIVDMGLKLSVDKDPVIDGTFLENFEVPIPLCNENFRLPGSGSVKALAKQMGGKIIGEVVEVIFKKLGLDTVFTDGDCTTQPSPPSCPWNIDFIMKYLPEKFQSRVKCHLADNCFGIQCCIDFSFNVPVFDKAIKKNIPVFFKFEPCDFKISVGFGMYTHEEVLLQYNWGEENILRIGKGDRAPITIKFRMTKYDKGFEVYLSLTVCIPIDGEFFCFPEEGLQLMNGDKVPACDPEGLVSLVKSNTSLTDWAKSRGLDALKVLSQSAARQLLDHFGVTQYLFDQRCDVSRAPFAPSVDGWRNECPKSLSFLPKLPKGLHCHIAESCTKIQCCFDVPYLAMSFYGVLNVDMCDYFIHAGFEKMDVKVNMLGDDIDLNKGVKTSADIKDVFVINVGLKKRDKALILDLGIKVCLEDKCMLELSVLSGTEVPQLLCDLNALSGFKNFSIKSWAKSKGQDLTNGLKSAALKVALDQLGLTDKMLSPACSRSSLKYQPSVGSWKNDCPLAQGLKLPNINVPGVPVNCNINAKCLGIDCCLESKLLGISLHADFSIDLCEFKIQGSLEKFSFKVNILDYDWGKEEVITIDGIPLFKITFSVDRVLSYQVFVVDLMLSLCFDGPECEINLPVLKQSTFPMPGCASLQGFKIPDFSLDSWLISMGGEITAQLSERLMKELGISDMLLGQPCQTYLTPFKQADPDNRWNNECRMLTSLSKLPSAIRCHLASDCTSISCCVEASMIKRTFNAYLLIDTCNYHVKGGIEKINFGYSLFDYEWGKMQEIDIGGIVKIEFSIDKASAKKLLVNLNAKLCMKAGEACQYTFPVFENKLIPKPVCDWEPTQGLAGFSLESFLKETGMEGAEKVTGFVLARLLDKLELTHYLMDTPCSTDARPANGWNSACPVTPALPRLPSALSCSIPTHCTGFDCCLDVPLISRNIHFKVDLDLCKYTLTLELEKLKFKRILFKYKWGELDSINLKGIFKAVFVIYKLEEERSVLVSLNVSACFETDKPCRIMVPVVKDLRFSTPVCDWSTASLNGFSLTSWKSSMSLSPGAVLSDIMRSKLAESLGISKFLQNPMCDRTVGIYKADEKGWNKACPRNLQLPTLPSGVSCHVPDYCTGIICCVTAEALTMSFNTKVLLDTCNYLFTASIENLELTTSLFSYTWGEWEKFNLMGLIRIEFKIEDLVDSRHFILNMKLSFCYESGKACAVTIPLVTDLRVPKTLCKWDYKLALDGFSLKNYLLEIGAQAGQSLTDGSLSKLLDRVELPRFLRDPQCSRSAAPYSGADQKRWKKDCPASLTLPQLPEGVSCHLSDPCGTVECCIDVPLIRRSVNVMIRLNPCDFTFTMGIEKLVMHQTLSAYKWGHLEHFSLRGVVRADFMISDMYAESAYLTTLNISVCFEENECLLSFPVLADVSIPKRSDCDWSSTAALADFNLDSFLAEHESTGAAKLKEKVTAQMFEKLKIGKYLKDTQCDVTKSPFDSAVNGWNNGEKCIVVPQGRRILNRFETSTECFWPDLSSKLPTLPSSLKCHIGRSCTLINCCAYVDYVEQSFSMHIHVNTCLYTLTVGIENVQHKLMLYDYTWGSEGHFYVGGVLRTDYLLSDIPADGQIEMSVNVSVCLKTGSCVYTEVVMDKVIVLKPFCDWSNMITAIDVPTLTEWSKEKGLSSVNAMTSTLARQLLSDMKFSWYQLQNSCDLTESPYSPANIDNWNDKCNSVTLPSLATLDAVRCHMASSCMEIDCCLSIPLLDTSVQAKFEVDVCGLEVHMTLEKFSFTFSLLQYQWGEDGIFYLGNGMVRILYNIDHIHDSKKLIVDVKLKVCFKDECIEEVFILNNTEIVYSPCTPSLNVPFKGVSLDFWKMSSCSLGSSSSSCLVSLPASLSGICRLSDNCMGVICCVDVNLRYLGQHTFSTGIMADHCNDELTYYLENKRLTKSLPAITYDTNMTETVGSAITLSYLVSKTPSLYEVSLDLKVCLFNHFDSSDVCSHFLLLDKMTFQNPSSCSIGTRRRRRSIAQSDPNKDNLRELVQEAIQNNVTNEEIKIMLNDLKQKELKDTAENYKALSTDDAGINTKTALKEMGQNNPATLMFSGEEGQPAMDKIEGGKSIMGMLGQGPTVKGRDKQAYTVGQGLTGAGVKLLGAKLAKTTIGQIIAMFDTKNIDPELAIKLTRQMRDLALALYSELISKFLDGGAEDIFKSFDLTLKGDFSFPRQSITFFEYQQFFLVGGLIPLTFGWGVGASYGMDIFLGCKILDMVAFGQVRPFANLHVWGEVGIGAILYGKLRLDGYIMSVAFPSKAEIGFSKFPLDLTLIMDLELTPLELVLSALVTLEIKIPLIGTIKEVLFQVALWKYKTPTITKRMLDISTKEKDESPPSFSSFEGGKKKTQRCTARQVPDRDYTEAAVEVGTMVEDDRSDVKLFVNAGTQPGLWDILGKVPMGGPSAILVQKFSVAGVPVYFTVFGENSGGEKASVTCSIPTYDITLPGGRLSADFDTTSNPAIMLASVVMFEDSDLSFSNIGVGLGKGIYADEIITYRAVNLKAREIKEYDASGDHAGYIAQAHFTGLKHGRLLGPVVAEFHGMTHAGVCVKACMAYSPLKCMSVNYDYGPAGHCELVEAIEGHDHKLYESDQYAHFERLGVGLAYEFSYPDLSLLHQAMYYFNLHVVNVLGYEKIISSRGVLVDLTPPEPGPLKNVSVDESEVADCKSLIPDDRLDWEERCVGMNNEVHNHRTIYDGLGSMTVFNGDEPLVDLLYTRANRYVTSNWDGMLDKETGILGYSWTLGVLLCQDLVHPHHDPHKHLYDESEWTHIGLISPIPDEYNPLADGKYYITLRALNKVSYGGPLVTMICHTTPLGIDNTQPDVYEVYDVGYDEESHNITAKYNASDPHSDIREVDLCLGQTTRDCYHLDWVRRNHTDGSILLRFEIPGGTPVWVKIRAINNVNLMRVGVADYPLIIDVTPPIAGTVYDGPVYKHDLAFTKDETQLCANWFGFYDPESAIARYEAIVHDDMGNNMSLPVAFDHKSHEACITMTSDNLLQHNQRYVFAVTAFNAGHKQLNVTTESDGVTVDLTPPIMGEVIDGRRDGFEDVVYSTHVATVASQWRDYSDLESRVREYSVQVTRAKNLGSEFEIIREWTTLNNETTEIEWHNFHLNHRDVVKTTLRATNNALGSVDQGTDGSVVDLTPPRMRFLGDGTEAGKDIGFQGEVTLTTSTSLTEKLVRTTQEVKQSATTLSANFDFYDEESGIDHFKFQVYEIMEGNKLQIYPAGGLWEKITDPAATTVTQDGLSLTTGARYLFRIGAISGAGAVASYDTNGVLLDNTDPSMEWVYVGIFSGSDEEVIDGYVIQSDPDGIKATWMATDAESGVESYMVAVGTIAGGTDVQDWKTVGGERDKYIKLNTALTVTDPVALTPVYFVSVMATNGAGLVSNTLTSKPIRVVREDVAGIVIDGADATEHPNFIGIGDDLDAQRDGRLVTVQFEGFGSEEHGVTYYDWAVGTTPGGEDVQPFMMVGLIHEETEPNVPGNGIASTGFGQAVLPLQSGTKYYTTIRGITNRGNILQSTSDGFMVDLTPPIIEFDSFAAENDKSKITDDLTIYQSEVDSLSASWTVKDSDTKVITMYYSVGTYPYGEDVALEVEVEVLLTGEGSLPVGVPPSTDGKSNFITLSAKNEVGLKSRIISPGLIVDTSAPSEGYFVCPRFIQPLSAVACRWTYFFDAESSIVEFRFAVGSSEGGEDILSPVSIPGHSVKYLIPGLSDNVSHGKTYYAKVTAVNTVGMTTSTISNPITVDATPPLGGAVVELKSTYFIDVTSEIQTEIKNTFSCSNAEDCAAIDAVCQESLTTVGVAWEAFTDEETGIVKYEIAVGTTPGGGQLKPMFEVPDITKRYFYVSGLVLKGERQIFVTVKATNGAGLSTQVSSNGVYISYLSQGLPPLEEVSVMDGIHEDGDQDFQTSISRISAQWDVSGDPCPVTKYEWKIQRADGLVVQDFLNSEGKTFGVNDELSMSNKERYYQILRVTNILNFTYTLHSNGITIEEDPLVPGRVNDGDLRGFDLQFLRTASKVSANWDGFGSDGDAYTELSPLKAEDVVEDETTKISNQEVAFYEVAVGTDRRFPKSRDNVVPFTFVGLNKTVTFFDLDLTPIEAIYYFSVRAHSTSGSKATVTSNGFSVGFDGGVTAGEIILKDFVKYDSQLEFAWSGFESQVGMLMYYVGVSTNTDASNYTCGDFTERGSVTQEEKKKIYDTKVLKNVGKDTIIKYENISLAQDEIYYAWVIGADMAGKCNMTSYRFHVDVTPPIKGKVRTGPYFDMKASYAADQRSLEAHWIGFTDEESGLRCYHLSLLKKKDCEESSKEEIVVDFLEINANYSSYKFLELNLTSSTPYIVRLKVENFAGLTSIVDSPLTLYVDKSAPVTGIVIDGHNFKKDTSWIGTNDTVLGTFLHHPVPDAASCPVRPVLFDDPSWKSFVSDANYDSNNNSLSLIYRSAYVHSNPKQLDIKLARDTKKATMFSGACYRDADMVGGGEYRLTIKAADAPEAVTSVMFWDGPDTYILPYDFTKKPHWSESNCACCDVEPDAASCSHCNCVEILEARAFYQNQSESIDSSPVVKRSVGSAPPPFQVKKLTKAEKTTLQKKKLLKPKEEVVKPNLDPQKACGLQVYSTSTSTGRLVVWCTFENYLNEPLEVARDLDFDPSADFQDYFIKFSTVREEAKDSAVTWCVEVHMNNTLMAEQCGIPQFSTNTTIFLSVWNHKNSMPGTKRDKKGHLKVWTSLASFKNLVIPPEKTSLCRYGKPFQGGTNAIVAYEAGIGTTPGLADIVPFEEVYKPCVPCLHSCDKFLCEPSCDATVTSQIKIKLTNFTLNSTELVDGQWKPITYYLAVKAVLGSGVSAVASSDGFNVDITPPTFVQNVFKYYDVSQGDFTPSQYQGSNSTIKGSWKCDDDESAVVNFDWAIGTTQGGTDIQAYQSSGENPGATNSGLEGLLEDHVKYYISVKCTNGGGVTSVHEDDEGVTVLLTNPNVDDVGTTIEGTEPLGDTVWPNNSRKTKNKNSMSCSWTVSKDKSITKYDFCVGSSSSNHEDVFPCIRVSYNASGTVKVEEGYVKIDGIKIRKLSEYRPDFNETMNKMDTTSFTMAPGTELFFFMKMCNEAKRCTYKSMGTSIIETDSSQLATSSDGSAITAGVNSNIKRRKRAATGITVETPSGLQPGQSIVITELTKVDLETEYRSDASVDFVPYITNPATTTTSCAFLERVLRRRLTYLETDVSFSITSIGGEPMPGPLIVSHPYDPADDVNVAMLLHWNPVRQKWEKSSRTCKSESDVEVKDPGSSRITVKVCDTRAPESVSGATSSRRRRATTPDNYFTSETQFLVTSSLATIPNDPPVLTGPTLIPMEEDQGTVIYQLTASDFDGDTINFKFDPSYSLPTDHDITLSEQGLLTFTPALNYYGTVSVPVVLHELPTGEYPPAEVTVTLTVNITSTNDASQAFTFAADGTSLPGADPTHPILILLEQNRENDSSTIYKWTFGAFDVDQSENLTVFYTQPNHGEITPGELVTTAPDCSAPGRSSLPCHNMSLPHVSSSMEWVYQSFSYTPNPNYWGYDDVRLYVQDKDGVSSDVITLRFTVMERPCLNGGNCSSRNESLYTCEDYRRAENFDLYYTCVCPPGWLQSHCEVDYDECISSPCQSPYTCYDQENDYFCACPLHDPNCDGLEVWVIGLIVLAIILLIILSLLAWIFFLVKRGRLKLSWLKNKLRGRKSDNKEAKTAFVNEGFADSEGISDNRMEVESIRSVESKMSYLRVPLVKPSTSGQLKKSASEGSMILRADQLEQVLSPHTVMPAPGQPGPSVQTPQRGSAMPGTRTPPFLSSQTLSSTKLNRSISGPSRPTSLQSTPVMSRSGSQISLMSRSSSTTGLRRNLTPVELVDPESQGGRSPSPLSEGGRSPSPLIRSRPATVQGYQNSAMEP